MNPITREESLLDGQDLTPITRKEQFIKRIYDKTQEIPEPITREEWFLKKAGEGTSPVAIEQLNVTENGTYSEAGKAYSPVIVDVPAPTLITKTITENGTYTASEDNADGYSQVTVAVEGFKKKSIANTPTDIASFSDGTANPMPSLEISIVPVQSGSGDPSPSNVRPISGWSGANVTRCGVNVWDEEWKVGTIDIRSGSTVPANDRIRSKNFIPCAPNTAYFYVVSVGNMTICFYDKNENYLSYYNFSSEHNFTTPDGCYKMKFFTGSAYGTTYNNDISINYPSTDTSYHAYNGSTLSIPFHDNSDNPITVYGGRLNVTTGELTATHVVQEVESIDNMITSGTLACVVYITNTKSYNNAPIISDRFVKGGLNVGECYIVGNGNNLVFVLDQSIDTVEEANEWCSTNKPHFVYPLATPQTYQLTPAQVTTLLGQNNIFADCGQVLDGEYFVTL